MNVCETCKRIDNSAAAHCPICGDKLNPAKTDDGFLLKFLEIDKPTLKRFKDIREQSILEAKTFLTNRAKRPIKALGISSSSRDAFDMAAESSHSEFLLEQALDELKKAKIETEMVKLRKLNVRPCKACYSTTNAQCHFYCSCYPKGTPLEDDMTKMMYDKVLESDIILFATPVNNFKISSHLALFLDRCISLDGSLAPANPKGTKDKALNTKHTQFISLMADPAVPGSGFWKRFYGKVGGILVTGHEEGASMAITQLFMTLNHFGMAFPPWSNMYAMASIEHPTHEDGRIVRDIGYAEEARQVARNTLSLAKALRKSDSRWEYDSSSN
jgi:multimeric flavodoxin WrbA